MGLRNKNQSKSKKQKGQTSTAVRRAGTFGLLSVALSVGASATGMAQTFAAAMTGEVTDATGAAIPGARVEIRNTGTNDTRELTSGSNGLFTAEQLPPGTYQLTVVAPGFKSFVENEITLVGSQRAEHNAHLELGSADQSVTVNAAQIEVNTQTADREVTISQEAIQSLPTSFRNPLYLVQSTAGVVSVRTGLSAYSTDQNQNRFALNGGRDESTAVLVDGASIVAPDLGGAIATPNMDATQEVQIQRTAYDAQFTHTDGGVVSLITKSGSNRFHGSAFEFLRNDKLDANSWDNNHYGIARPSFHRNQFGGSIGGFVKRDKLFFFGAYEGLRLSEPQTYSDRVPTAMERQGDFSKSVYADGSPVQIFNPFDVVNGQRQPFAGSVIPSSMFDKVGAAAVAFFPNPTSSNATGNNFASTGLNSAVYDKMDLRGDWIVNAKDTAFVRLTKAWQLNSFPDFYKNAFDPWQGESDYRQAIILSNTWTPSATWVMNTIVSYGKWTEVDTSAAFGHDPTTLGLPAATVGQFQAANAYPQFNVENYTTLGLSNQNNTPHETDGLQVNFSHALKNHSLKFGFLGEIQRLYPAALNSPTFNFNSGMTAGPTAVTDGTDSGNSVASLLLGTGSSGSVPYTAKLDLQQLNFGVYVQDTWRASDRLTVTAGLRWDVQNARTERFNRLNTFDPTATSQVGMQPVTGGLEFATNGNRGLWQAQHDNFDPRVSFAYKLNERLVARAGYGLFNPNTYNYSGAAQSSSDGYSATTTWQATVGGNGLTPQNLVSNPFPNGLTQPIGSSQGLQTLVGNQIHASLRRHPTPYAQVFSADLQLQITSSGTLEMGYAGSQGRQLHYGVFSDLDQLPSNFLALGSNALNASVANPFYGQVTGSGEISGPTVPYWRTLIKYPQYTSVQLLPDTVGSSSGYNALNVKYNQRFGFGLSALLTYQWSKAIDDTSENNGWEVQDAIRDTFNHKLDRSISAHDIPQSFVGSVQWKLPFGRGEWLGSNVNSVVNGFIGGWKLNTIARFNTGLPLHFTQNNNLSTYNYMVSRPNVTSMAALKPARRTIDQWFNTSAVVQAGTDAAPALGNIPRYVGNVRYNITNDTDMAMEKAFSIYRESQLQFRIEAYNVTNTPEYGRPDVNLGDSSFGQITSTGSVGPRTLQVGVRLDF